MGDEFYYVDKDGKKQDAELHQELLGDDDTVYLSPERLARYTPDEIERLFGVPKEEQTVGWHKQRRR